VALHGMPQRWRGHPLRTIRNVYSRRERWYVVPYGVLDCGHEVCLAGHSRNKVGERTKCPLCK